MVHSQQHVTFIHTPTFYLFPYLKCSIIPRFIYMGAFEDQLFHKSCWDMTCIRQLAAFVDQQSFTTKSPHVCWPLDTSLNTFYLSASFKLVVVSAFMS